MSIGRDHKNKKGAGEKQSPSPADEALAHATLVEASDYVERELESLDNLNRMKVIKEVADLFELKPLKLYEFIVGNIGEGVDDDDTDTTQAFPGL